MAQQENCLFHGLPAVRLTADDGATVTITLHGAHVVSWTSAAGVEQLYLSPLTRFDGGQAIRGGVPVVFPQFNTRGPLPRHGFARTAAWNVVEGVATDAGYSVTLALPNSPAIQAIWPHTFACTLKVSLAGDSLTMALTVSNLGADSFSFQAALHTYLEVGSIGSVSIKGLDDSDFEDTTVAGNNTIKRHTALQAYEPIDRIYFNAPKQQQLESARGLRKLQQTGFTDVVVWNPGDLASGFPPDLPQSGFQHFLCVEAAQIGQAVVLAPQQVWTGTQTIALG